jgi:hypothetical protein
MNDGLDSLILSRNERSAEAPPSLKIANNNSRQNFIDHPLKGKAIRYGLPAPLGLA